MKARQEQKALSGPTGPAGTAPGPQGPSGAEAPDGLDAPPGPVGSPGDTGAVGEPGAPGAQGTKGPTGAPGAQGIPGLSGLYPLPTGSTSTPTLPPTPGLAQSSRAFAGSFASNVIVVPSEYSTVTCSVTISASSDTASRDVKLGCCLQPLDSANQPLQGWEPVLLGAPGSDAVTLTSTKPVIRSWSGSQTHVPSGAYKVGFCYNLPEGQLTAAAGSGFVMVT
ncbi:hypothetical protein HYH03_017316 [Edaphochlamys debaryana]|uniref:Collagen-like protein n=1 Tax=Edaphochlamys debaryana TaxID=47281 RepID=A0A836BQK5_9CHLO|nr:hypothetical protein HYH03_017316 [Edaphochlamys debaryana]|eukprot:KAG2483864.1 hypothetical protein HYH03_017316 [Edaphochlamys debaryana]